MRSPFLTASWRKLIMAQYEVDPELLVRRLPPGLELDLFQGRCFVSLVGFLFDRVRLLALPIPFHTSFEEINLRFYVRRRLPDGTSRRGVVFLSEIVPRPAITLVARTLYGEAYSTAPTAHRWSRPDADRSAKPPKGGRIRAAAHFRHLRTTPFPPERDALLYEPARVEIEYEWRHRGLWQRLGVQAANRRSRIVAGSLEEFITDHYWGYAPRRAGGTTEYEVEHRRWEVYPVEAVRVAADFHSLYGREFAELGQRSPDHVLLAEGAPVAIYWGGRIA